MCSTPVCTQLQRFRCSASATESRRRAASRRRRSRPRTPCRVRQCKFIRTTFCRVFGASPKDLLRRDWRFCTRSSDVHVALLASRHRQSSCSAALQYDHGLAGSRRRGKGCDGAEPLSRGRSTTPLSSHEAAAPGYEYRRRSLIRSREDVGIARRWRTAYVVPDRSGRRRPRSIEGVTSRLLVAAICAGCRLRPSRSAIASSHLRLSKILQAEGASEMRGKRVVRLFHSVAWKRAPRAFVVS